MEPGHTSSNGGKFPLLICIICSTAKACLEKGDSLVGFMDWPTFSFRYRKKNAWLPAGKVHLSKAEYIEQQAYG